MVLTPKIAAARASADVENDLCMRDDKFDVNDEGMKMSILTLKLHRLLNYLNSGACPYSTSSSFN